MQNLPKCDIIRLWFAGSQGSVLSRRPQAAKLPLLPNAGAYGAFRKTTTSPPEIT